MRIFVNISIFMTSAGLKPRMSSMTVTKTTTKKATSRSETRSNLDRAEIWPVQRFLSHWKKFLWTLTFFLFHFVSVIVIKVCSFLSDSCISEAKVHSQPTFTLLDRRQSSQQPFSAFLDLLFDVATFYKNV